LKTFSFLSIFFVGACAISSIEVADTQNVESLIDQANKLAPPCIVEIDEPIVCTIASCQWRSRYENCFDGERPKRRSLSKAACSAFDDALQPALAPLKICSSNTALSS